MSYELHFEVGAVSYRVYETVDGEEAITDYGLELSYYDPEEADRQVAEWMYDAPFDEDANLHLRPEF